MNEPILALDEDFDTLRPAEEAQKAADADDLAVDAQPRISAASAARASNFEGFFVPRRRQRAKAVPTYMALTRRPDNFEGCFVPSRRQCADNTIPMYRASVGVVFAPSHPSRSNRVRIE